MSEALFHPASRVLIVDDEVHIARFLQYLLNREGYHTAGAYDGAEALEQFSAFQPDAILLDVVLPKLSGLEVLQRIYENAESPVRPIVLLLTGMNRQDLQADMIKFGVAAYCPKPVAPTALIRLLHRFGLYGFTYPRVSRAAAAASAY